MKYVRIPTIFIYIVIVVMLLNIANVVCNIAVHNKRIKDINSLHATIEIQQIEVETLKEILDEKDEVIEWLREFVKNHMNRADKAEIELARLQGVL